MKPTKSFKILVASVVGAFALSSVANADIVYGSGTLTTASPTSPLYGPEHPRKRAKLLQRDSVHREHDRGLCFRDGFDQLGRNSEQRAGHLVGGFCQHVQSTDPGRSPDRIRERRLHRHLHGPPWPLYCQRIDGHLHGIHGRLSRARVWRTPGITLTAGTQYFLYLAAFRDTTFVSTTTAGQAIGAYYLRRQRPWDDLDRPGTDHGCASRSRRSRRGRRRVPETEIRLALKSSRVFESPCERRSHGLFFFPE